MHKLAIFGHSGFVGTNLVKYLENNFIIEKVNNNKNKISQDMSVYINLIGKAHDHKGIYKEEDYIYANYEIVKKIYNQFINSSAKLFIHISSIAAIEEENSNNILIETSQSNPISIYGKSKKMAEDFLLNQTFPENKKVIILRPTMIHGKGDKGNLILLYKLVSKGIPYPLGAFENKRSFLAIDNFCFIISEIIKKDINSGIYNICDDNTVSTKNIINIINHSITKKTLIINIPKFIINSVAYLGDFLKLPLNSKRLNKMTSNLIVSNQKIKTALRIDRLPFTAEEGLIKTIKSFKENK